MKTALKYSRLIPAILSFTVLTVGCGGNNQTAVVDSKKLPSNTSLFQLSYHHGFIMGTAALTADLKIDIEKKTIAVDISDLTGAACSQSGDLTDDQISNLTTHLNNVSIQKSTAESMISDVPAHYIGIDDQSFGIGKGQAQTPWLVTQSSCVSLLPFIQTLLPDQAFSSCPELSHYLFECENSN